MTFCTFYNLFEKKNLIDLSLRSQMDRKCMVKNWFYVITSCGSRNSFIVFMKYFIMY